jgi:putative spermidine/putrescine transport system ATP-binding protein
VKAEVAKAQENPLPETGRKRKLSVRGATKVHGTVVALDSASFDLFEGEFLTLLGPSGSGKTTLLMLIAGLSEPTAGEIWIDGKLATYAPPHLRDIGMVFQNYALFPHLTVRENIAFPLRMRGVPNDEIDSQVADALRTVQLEHTSDRLPRSLSGGQQQRIALARCFVYRPSIILMDEPLGALDRKLRDKMQVEINQLHRELGITVLYVTHDQDEAMTMSDRICLMNEGKIEQIGTPEELYFRPRSIFAADFIGDSNLIDVTIERVAPDGTCRLAGPALTSLAAARTDGSGDGTKARLMVRPERVRVLAPGETAANAVRGTTREVLFVGSAYKYCVELADGTRIWGRQLSNDGGTRPVPGHELVVGWDISDCVVLSPGLHG